MYFVDKVDIGRSFVRAVGGICRELHWGTCFGAKNTLYLYHVHNTERSNKLTFVPKLAKEPQSITFFNF